NEYKAQQRGSAIQKLIESDVRGVAIMTSSLDKSSTSELTAAGIATVFCNLGPAERLISNVAIDYPRGISQAIEHVTQLGHRHAAVIAGPEDNRTAVTIREALVMGLRQRNLQPVAVINCNYRVDSGASAVRAILSALELP